MPYKETVSFIIFVITYIGIIFTRLPKMNIDRPSAAFFGAVAMIIFNILPFEVAINAIDFNTIALLLGMMIIITTLQIDGFFAFIAHKTISYAKNPTRLLIIIVFVTGLTSAFLVNDAVVLIFTPIIIMICSLSSLNPIPFLIAEILSSNVGSVMTITGNPQNMLIGINSGISYGKFIAFLFPVSLFGMFIIIIVVKSMFSKSFNNKQTITVKDNDFKYDFKSMKFSIPIFIGVLLLFFFNKLLHLSIPVIALLGASLILIIGKVKPSTIIKEVDWVLLLFFASLFIVVKGVESTHIMQQLISITTVKADFSSIAAIHSLSLIMSQIVSNVPFTVLMLPLMKHGATDIAWLSLASASTLAGNATIIGAMANLIVIELAEKLNVRIRFFEFLKVGIIVTLITLIFSVVYLYLLT